MARPRDVPPAGLFDRMRTDHDPIRTAADYRNAVIADLHDLLGSTQRWAADEIAGHPLVAQSILNYGTAPRPGRVVSRDSILELTDELRETILRFDSRFDRETLSITPVDSRDEITLVIEGTLLGWPTAVPFFTAVRADFDSGSFDMTPAATVGRAA